MATRVNVAPLLLAQLFLRRIEWASLIALLICLVAASMQWLILPDVERRAQVSEQSLIGEPAEPARSASASRQDDRYRAFQSRLGEYGERDALLKTVFAQAGEAGIPLTQGDYNLIYDTVGDFDKLQINLPVKGKYQQIRVFTESLLGKLPSLAMDEISFRRENVKSPSVEARLRLTLYLKHAP